MIDDEMQRASSTQFTLLHPTKATAEHYLSLYRIQRFTDHLLAKWVVDGRSTGLAGLYIPAQYLDEDMLHLRENKRKSLTQRSIRVPGSPSMSLGGERSYSKFASRRDREHSHQQQQLIGSSSANSTPRTRVIRHIDANNTNNNNSSDYIVSPASTISAPFQGSLQQLITVPDGQAEYYTYDMNLTRRARKFLTSTKYSQGTNGAVSTVDHDMNVDEGSMFKSVNTTILDLITAGEKGEKLNVSNGRSRMVRPPRPVSASLINGDYTHAVNSLGDEVVAMAPFMPNRRTQKAEEMNIRLKVAGLTMGPSFSTSPSSSLVQSKRSNNYYGDGNSATASESTADYGDYDRINDKYAASVGEAIDNYQDSNIDIAEQGWYSPRV